MNILLINPVHPATPHVSAVRAWRFAKALAVLGHRVLLLTASRQGQATDSIDARANHDWQQPFILACENANEELGMEARLPKPLRKARTAWRMLRHGGKLEGWTVNAVRAARGLSDRFAPDVVWCTFGMMEAVIAAKRIAGSVGCPWVLDIKDNWGLYVPRGLRHLMIWRTRGWAALTANARFTAEKARLWQGAEATVVYSGVDESFFARGPDIDESEKKSFCINLIGSIYFEEHLESFLKGVATWADSLLPEQRSRIVVRYLGGDGRLVGEVAQRCVPEIEITSAGYLAAARMAHYCRSAAVNAYIVHSEGFHHKLLELLACGRPVMVCPVESDESRDLARKASGVLLEVSDSAQVSSELSKLHRSWLSAPGQAASPDPVRRYSWADQARVLEQALADVVSRLERKS